MTFKSLNVRELITHFYDARLQNEVAPCLACYSKDARFEYAGDDLASDFAGSFLGADALQTRITDIIATWPWRQYELLNVLVNDNHAAVRCQIVVEHAPSGKVVTTQLFDHFEFDADGSIAHQIEFADTAMIEKLTRGA